MSTDHQESEVDEETDAAIANTLQHSINGREYISYDKSTFELCCFHCRCGNDVDHTDQVLEILPSLSRRSSSSSSSYSVRLHRTCCSTIKQTSHEEDNTYAVTSYGIATTTPPCNKKATTNNKVNRTFLSKAYDESEKLRRTAAADYSCKDPVQFRATDERYLDNCRVYDATKLKANPADGSNNKSAANVLSLFSGIGAGILVLKRLQIAINNCIVVEHDPLAEAVCSGNHKKDVAKYIWIKKFEELEDKLDEYMEQYGPFHIIEGGPPCIEFSPVNANRAGVNSSKGSYMKRYAQIINKIKKHRKQNSEPVFFLCENVTLEWEDLSTIEPLFQISPIEIDAQYLSPMKRKRSYITNLPVNELPDIDSDAATSTVELADGWMDPAQLHCQMNSDLPEVYSKAKTLMASDTRIDDDRMIKVRLRDPSDRGSIEASTYSVADRESLMGFRIGYVQRIVDSIFEKMNESFHSEDWLENALINGWCLESLGMFSACSYKFVCDDKTADTTVKVKLGTVEKNRKGKTLYHFDSEGYCKRLLGNSYSIPVVEHLLRPLKDLYQEKQYDENASYEFSWQ